MNKNRCNLIAIVSAWARHPLRPTHRAQQTGAFIMQTTQIINRLDRVRILESFTPSRERMCKITNELANKVAYGSSPAHIQRLLYRLQNAKPVTPTMIPKDMVTMNSIVRICDQGTLRQQRVALVYPGTDHDAQNNALPVGVEAFDIQTELGSELLGRRLGDAFTIRSRGLPTEFRITAIEYQPESAGHYDR